MPADANRLFADVAAAFCGAASANATLYWYTGGAFDGVNPDMVGQVEVTGSSRIMVEIVRNKDIEHRRWGGVEAGDALFWLPTSTDLQNKRGVQIEVNGERWVVDIDPPRDIKAHATAALPMGHRMAQWVFGRRRKDHN
jgi:hypothetical protein